MRKSFVVLLGLLLATSVYADELIVDFKDESIPVLNEELRKKDQKISSVENRVTVLEGASYTPTAANALTGSVIQTVTTSSNTYSSLGATAIPYDDSLPQQATEGAAVTALNTAITPNSASNLLIIDCQVHLSNAGNNIVTTLALFQDSTASALAAMTYQDGGNENHPFNCRLRYVMTAGTVSSTTFKLKAGDAPGSAIHINGSALAAARRLGGAFVSSMTITEIKV